MSTRKANATEEAKARVKFTGVDDEAVNNALNDYNDVRKSNGLDELTQDRVDASTRGFNVGDELMFGPDSKWVLTVGEVKDAQGKVTETYPAITNGATTLSIKVLCKQIVSGFSGDNNAVFYAATQRPKNKADETDFSKWLDVQESKPTLESNIPLEEVARFMQKKSEFSPLRLWCEIKAGKSDILESFTKLIYRGSIMKQGIRRTGEPFVNKIAVWEMEKK
ncbi:MAG: hypothetical protein MR996_08605 [Ruminococcus sp.]|nr:hypothetical protein [Ruminococcus sp.]MCI6506399.1 hypothetical protein [Ruminococcus sp.]